MSLLPNNETKISQNFAQFIDEKSKVDYSDIGIEPLSCDASLLPHLALIKGANINGMLESEARQYLNTFSKKAIGTIGAVKDAVDVHFKDAVVIEWYQDKENLAKGMFRIDVNTKTDKNVIYDERLFSLSNRLIQNSKNVRSKLDSFNMKLPLLTENLYVKSSSISTIQLANKIDLKNTINLKIGGAVVWTI